MKKIFILILVITFVFTSSALAEFKVSVFDDSPDYSVVYDDMAATHTIALDLKAVMDNTMDSEHGFIRFLPAIAAFDGQFAILGIQISYYRRFAWDQVQEVIIKVGDVRYDFNNLKTTEVEGKVKEETINIFLGAETLSIVTAIVRDPTVDVKVRLVSSDGTEDFVINDFAKNNAKSLYIGYINAGGTAQSPTANALIESHASAATIQ